VPDLAVPTLLSTETVVAVSHLSRRFGAKTALDGVSLAVRRGCVFGLVGENGAGKSTLIKHLLGLWHADTGSVRVFGLDLLHTVQSTGARARRDLDVLG
jgi:ABC-2 type transport system ATP-binding protein